MADPIRYSLPSGDELLVEQPHVGLNVSGSSGKSLENVAEAIQQALANPRNYPAFSDCTVPGDRVAISVEPNLPRAVELVRGALKAITSAGIESSDVALVATADDSIRWETELGEAVRVERHKTGDEEQLCFAGMDTDEEPVQVNRTLFEADVVLPIGLARGEQAVDNYGLFGSFCALFGDKKIIERFAKVGLRTKAEQKKLQDLTATVGRLLGAQLLVQVVPSLEGGIAEVIAGEAQTVWEDVATRLALPSEQQASLAIAILGDQKSPHTWNQVANAVVAALQVVSDGGAIAVCCKMNGRLGQSLQMLAKYLGDPAAAQRSLEGEAKPDSHAAWQFTRALEQGPVYLLSQLDSEKIEDIGITPLEGGKELSRLASRHESCAVLPGF